MDIMYKIVNNIEQRDYIRMYPLWYKEINRHPERYQDLINEKNIIVCYNKGLIKGDIREIASGDLSKKGMGTTVVAAIISDEYVFSIVTVESLSNPNVFSHTSKHFF